MKEECLICKAPLQYLETDEVMECAICHKKQNSKAKCVNGHFVCDECHTSGIDEIISICSDSKSANPIEILENMMSMPSCHMHGPEHHTMVGCALLTAYKNAGGDVDLHTALAEMHKRAKQVPGGACGFWGACGAGVSTGMFVSIATKSTPLAEKAWGLSNQMTAKALDAIGKNGGPRCCKRDSYIAITEAVKFAKENLGVKMELGQITCSRTEMNNQCSKANCPFYNNGKAKSVTVVAKKRLQKEVRIDYLYLDLKTCDRCIGTDDVLEQVIKELKPILALAGYGIYYNKTEIATKQDAVKHRFLSSPTIRINGRDICDKVQESDCGCCGEISGTQVDCRTFEYNGKLYNIPPKAMLAEAILKYAFTAETDSRQTKYQLPKNLEKFFEGKEKKRKLK